MWPEVFGHEIVMDDGFLAREKCALGRLDVSTGGAVNAKWKENYSRPCTEGL